MSFVLCGTSSKKNLGPCWQEVVSERNLVSAVFADCGLGDTCLALLQFKDNTFEVGEGEALRPYTQHYTGGDGEQATKVFLLRLREIEGAEEDPRDESEKAWDEANDQSMREEGLLP